MEIYTSWSVYIVWVRAYRLIRHCQRLLLQSSRQTPTTAHPQLRRWQQGTFQQWLRLVLLMECLRSKSTGLTHQSCCLEHFGHLECSCIPCSGLHSTTLSKADRVAPAVRGQGLPAATAWTRSTRHSAETAIESAVQDGLRARSWPGICITQEHYHGPIPLVKEAFRNTEHMPKDGSRQTRGLRPRTLPGSVRAGCATSRSDMLHGRAGACVRRRHFHQDLNNECMQVPGAYTVE